MKTHIQLKNILAIILLISAFTTSVNSLAQNGTISGNVKTETGIAMIGVLVSDSLHTWQVYTDVNGNFKIENLTLKSYTVLVSANGFEKASYKVDVSANQATQLDIVLELDIHEMPQITVIEKRSDALYKIPGSVKLISHTDIINIDAVNGNEVLRKIPGVHLVDEEGAGLRMNLSIRGTDPDRSRSVLVLEDGIPVALAPYGEPELYYTPSMDRMSGVEVVKGSGSILFGPQTIGGVINFLTMDPPAKESGSVLVRGGQGGYYSLMAGYGNTINKTGFYFSLLHKQADNFGALNFNVTDFTGKVKFPTGDNSALGLKFGIYNETSNSTYVGMTLPMYNAGIYDQTNIPADDLLAIQRYSASATHSWFINSKSSLKTTIYAYNTVRNWRRQNFTLSTLDSTGAANPLPSDWSGVTWGDSTVENGALYMRKGTGNRNRQFDVAGAETKYQLRFKLGNISNEFNIGGRLLFERAYEQRINGAKPDASTGTLKEYEIRTGYGSSAYIHNRTDITSKFSATYGVRFENFNYRREILYGEFTNPVTGVKKMIDTSIVAGSLTQEFIPGIGLTFIPNKNTTIFGGVHRGFAPPRIKDAISASGVPYELDAELSWNYELGARTTFAKGIEMEATLFYMDFSNQIIPVSESSGGTGAGLVNGGRTEHYGAEAAIQVNFHEFFKTKEKIMLSVNTTYVNATFSSDRFLSEGDDLINVNGNKVPYSPEFIFNSVLRYESNIGLGTQINFSYVGKQYSDALNTTEMSNDGLTGVIPAYKLIDVMVKYNLKKINTTFSISGINITDERFIVSYRPQGIRVGMPRFVIFGVKYEF
ncbi:MAG: TonB-dependent receptor plug domain-containing protein [Crocinitomicaceae bacterium]|nr:TonB-dependent receptor plug domain-containing protein [Crocinitomicaceae bacterium]